MTPEQEIETIISGVHPQCGHWPYARDADIYVGWRVGEESFEPSGNRPVRVSIIYDVAIVHTYELTGEAETLRYRLYEALREKGWRLSGPPGPEATMQAHRQRMWPFSVTKGFMLRDGVPHTEG